MAVSFCLKSRAVKSLVSVVMICCLLPGSFAWGALQPPLSQTTNPVFGTTGGIVPATASLPPHLTPYIKDVTAAIQLGKALFWDMQVGSDGVTACASCHYRAGADPVAAPVFDQITTHKRTKNQLHPGPDTIFGNNSTVIKTFVKAAPVDLATGLPVPVFRSATGFPIDPNVPGGASRFAPNYTLNTLFFNSFTFQPNTADFPLFALKPPTARLLIDPLTLVTGDEVGGVRDTNDVVGSQGVRLAQFADTDPNANPAVDVSTPLTDQLFHINAAAPANNIRQVTRRNAPSVINAVFNYANFWDGRANNIFNGATPFGPLDQTAGIWIDDNVSANLVSQKIAIPNSSLASQAVGPALSDVEMSFKGRTFPELGRKMLGRTPLANQLVHPNDSVFSSPTQLSNNALNPGTKGLNTKYRDMVKAAFQDNLWISNKKINLPATVSGLLTTSDFTQIEANFALFWGLAIQMYEATLVSDQTPFDRFQAGNQNALSPDLLLSPTVPSAVRGFSVFDGKCTVCHSGSELTSAVVGSNSCPPATLATECNRAVFTNNSTHRLIQTDTNPETLGVGLIDTGFFNIGVRPTADDVGRGGSAPSGLPLSFTKLAELRAQGQLPFATPILTGLPADTPTNVNGAFKAPGLRNVELTAPYFHNGGALTLEHVVEFYARGGNFPNNPELSLAMQPFLRGQAGKQADLVEFLKALTDERVRNETAPFDHPELMIPNGVDGVDASVDAMITLSATGGAPAAVPAALVLQSPAPAVAPANLTTLAPTTLNSLVLNGTVDASATIEVKINALPPIFAPVTGTTWSLSFAPLPVGNNTITITASTPGGVPDLITVSPLTVLPVATINGAPSSTGTKQNDAFLTITGAGVASYQYSLDNGPFSAVTPIAKQIVLTGLTDGLHTVAVLGRDATGNLQQPLDAPSIATWIVKTTPPLLTINQTNSPTGSSTQTISGTVALGSIPSITIDTSATVGQVKVIPGVGISTWSCDITGLAAGTNTVTAIALDFVFNQSLPVTGSITRILPDGNFKGTGETDISDALKAMRFAVGPEQPTAMDLLHGDVAPLVNGVVAQDGKIDISDALLILRKIVGLVTF